MSRMRFARVALLLLPAWVSFGVSLFGQPLLLGASDGLSLDSVTAWVLKEHPLAIAAAAVEARGPAELLAARGAYDPTLRGSFDRKDYLGTEYFQYGQAGVSWQSPYAIKLEGGREWADGVFLNAERTVPDAGQAYLSVKLPLLQGLLTDKYRVGVAQAEVAVERNRAAAEVIRNELRYDIAIAYTNWALAASNLRIYRNNEDLLREYLNATIGLYSQGDKPAVDTLEASVYLVSQSLITEQAQVDLTVASQELAALYFPLVADDVPATEALMPELPILQNAVSSNPELALLRGDAAQQELERRLKREYLKPSLEVGYSILGDGFELAPNSEEVNDRNFLTRAYKVGAEFRYPIFNRTARGQVALADIKLAETGAKLEGKRQELQAKASAYQAAALRFEAQLEALDRFSAQARGLLEAERELFELGEGTQFLLNARAQSLQKALLTRAKLLALRAKAIWQWRQAVGEW